MSKLIAIGCSYTEHYLNSMHTETKLDYPRWPELLAKKLDMECVNLGLCGIGHEYMIFKLLEVLMSKKDIGLVVIMWSEWQRMEFEHEDGWQQLMPHRDNSSVEKWPLNRDGRITLLQYNNETASTIRSLRYFLMAQELLKDIPYLMVQGCNPLVDPMYLHPEDADVNWENVINLRKKAIKQIINSPITDKIKEKYFIGWPIFKSIGGFYLDNVLDDIDPNRTKLRVDENDSHPNKRGHKVFSEVIYKRYSKVYKPHLGVWRSDLL